jgi:hypothetical protein
MRFGPVPLMNFVVRRYGSSALNQRLSNVNSETPECIQAYIKSYEILGRSLRNRKKRLKWCLSLCVHVRISV